MLLLPYKTETDIPLYTLMGGFDRIIIGLIAIGLFGYYAINLLPDRSHDSRRNWFLTIFWVFSILLSAPFVISNAVLGTNEMEPILIFFKDNQIDDIKTIGLNGFKDAFIFWGSLIIGILAISYYLLISKKHAERLLAALGLILLASSPLMQYLGRQVLPNAAHANFDVASRLHAPVFQTKPDHKKNLVIIYLESIERSYGQIPEFDAFYKPIKKLAARGVEFTDVSQITGTNYTIAGMVATHCGVPLLPNGLKSITSLGKMSSEAVNFMPKIRCLGDVLSDEGYTLSYMNGASLDKFSKRVFLKSHGYTRFFDYKSLPDDVKTGRMNVWGLNDALLFEEAVKEYEVLKSAQSPFVLSLLTLSTHGPDAFLDKNCPPASGLDSQLPRAIECTGQLVTDLVDHIDKQGDAENTVVVVMSDHLALFNSLRAQLATIGAARRNLFIMLGAGSPATSSRPMSSFDHYPSILESLGYALKEGRANYGVSANSTTQNLMEELGRATINKTFKSNQKLASFLWNSSTP